MEEQHLLPSERNPSTIQIKKEQIGRMAQFLLFFYHYSTSSSFSCSKSIQDVSRAAPPHITSPHPSVCQLLAIAGQLKYSSSNSFSPSMLSFFLSPPQRLGSHTLVTLDQLSCTICPLSALHTYTHTYTHTHTRAQTATLALKCGSYWQRCHAREQFMFIGLCQNKYNI